MRFLWIPSKQLFPGGHPIFMSFLFWKKAKPETKPWGLCLQSWPTISHGAGRRWLSCLYQQLPTEEPTLGPLGSCWGHGARRGLSLGQRSRVVGVRAGPTS